MLVEDRAGLSICVRDLENNPHGKVDFYLRVEDDSAEFSKFSWGQWKSPAGQGSNMRSSGAGAILPGAAGAWGVFPRLRSSFPGTPGVVKESVKINPLERREIPPKRRKNCQRAEESHLPTQGKISTMLKQTLVCEE